MKLSKSVLLSIALFGASASIFSYAAVYNVEGVDANARGIHFKNLLTTVNDGDEIVLNEEVKVLRQTGKLDIKNITISGNNNRLHIEGANLNLIGSAKFKDLNLSLRPDSGLIGAFEGLAVSGPDAMPTFIITNGNSLTLDNVTTNVDGDNKGVIRPIILAGGGNSTEPEILTITNSKDESKFHSIIVDSTKKLNDAGNNFANNDSRSEKEITINLDANSRVLNELNLAGIDKSQSPNNKISINSETLNIGNFGNSSKDGIRIGGAKNVNLTFSNVKSTLHPLKIVDDSIGLKTLTLDRAEVILKKNSNIETLELKNTAKLNVESTPAPDDYSDPSNYNIAVTTLKADENSNTLKIDGDSSVNIATIEGNTTGLKVTGRMDKFTLAEGETHTYNSSNGTFTPKKKEESSNTSDSNPDTSSSTSEPEEGRSETGPSGPGNTNGTGSAAGGDQTGGDATVGDQAGGTAAGGAGGSNVDKEENQDEENQGGTGTNTGDAGSTSNGTGGETHQPDSNPNTPSGPTNTENTGDGGSISTTTTPTGADTGTSTPEASNTDGGGKQGGTEESTGGDQSGKESDSTNGATGTGEATDGSQSGVEGSSTNGNDSTEPSTETSEDGATDTSGQQPPTNKPTEPSTESTTTTNPTGTETEDQPSGKEDSTEGEVVPKPSEGNTEGGAPSTPEAQPVNPSDTGNAANGGSSTETDPSAGTVTPEASGNAEEENPNGKQDGGENGAVKPSKETSEDGATDTSEPQPPTNKPTEPSTESTTTTNPTGTETEDQPSGKEGSAESEVDPKPSKETSEEEVTDTSGQQPPAAKPTDPNTEGATTSGTETDPDTATGDKPGTPATTDDEPQGDDPNANGEPADVDATKPVTPAQPSEKPTEKPAEKPAAKPAETPKEQPAEKSIKDSIIDALKGLFIRNNLDEKQQQQVAEKTEESLKDLASAYADYDFIFSLDAARVTENRLNDLSMLNGLESASIDNYAFLAQSARALKARNSVWVSTSIGQQRGDSKRRSHSINLGYDEQFGNLLFGTFVSYLHQKGERGELSSKLHGYAFNIYAKYNQDAHEVIGLLNVGRSKAHLQRNISALGVSNQADAKGKFVGLRVEYGYRMPFEQYGLQIKPLVGLSYNLGRQAAFTEHGTVMPVHVGKIKAQRLSLEAGVELKKYFETAYIYAKPMIQTDLMARSNDVDVRFVDTPNSIPFKSATKKKTYFALSLGTQVQLRKNLLLDVNANSRIGNNERDIQGSVKLGYKF